MTGLSSCPRHVTTWDSPTTKASESVIMSNWSRTWRTFCSESSFNIVVTNEGRCRLVTFPIVSPELPNSDGSGLSCGPLNGLEKHVQCCRRSVEVMFRMYRHHLNHSVLVFISINTLETSDSQRKPTMSMFKGSDSGRGHDLSFFYRCMQVLFNRRTCERHT